MSSAAPSTQPPGRRAWFVGDFWGATPPGPEDISLQYRPPGRASRRDSPRSTNNTPSDESSGVQQEPKFTTKVRAMHFSAADKELLDSGKYADAKIVANGKTYNVHKIVLCTRSVWFRKVFEGAFREGHESVVEISASDNIERVIEFLYTGAVDLSNETDLMTAANELFVLADFYLSDEMSEYAQKILGEYLGETLNKICNVEQGNRARPTTGYVLGGTGRRDTGDFYCQENFDSIHKQGFMERLCAAIRDAYATPSGIHRVYVDFVYAARMHTFRDPLIQDLRDEIPDFGRDILKALMHGPRSSALLGNKAFEQWKDGLANPVAVLKAKRDNPLEELRREDREWQRSGHRGPAAVASRDVWSSRDVW